MCHVIIIITSCVKEINNIFTMWIIKIILSTILSWINSDSFYVYIYIGNSAGFDIAFQSVSRTNRFIVFFCFFFSFITFITTIYYILYRALVTLLTCNICDYLYESRKKNVQQRDFKIIHAADKNASAAVVKKCNFYIIFRLYAHMCNNHIV